LDKENQSSKCINKKDLQSWALGVEKRGEGKERERKSYSTSWRKWVVKVNFLQSPPGSKSRTQTQKKLTNKNSVGGQRNISAQTSHDPLQSLEHEEGEGGRTARGRKKKFRVQTTASFLHRGEPPKS